MFAAVTSQTAPGLAAMPQNEAEFEKLRNQMVEIAVVGAGISEQSGWVSLSKINSTRTQHKIWYQYPDGISIRLFLLILPLSNTKAYFGYTDCLKLSFLSSDNSVAQHFF